jgi:hypothetical protein
MSLSSRQVRLIIRHLQLNELRSNNRQHSTKPCRLQDHLWTKGVGRPETNPERLQGRRHIGRALFIC